MSLKQIALYVSIISSVISAPLESVLLSEDKTEIKLLNNTSQEIVLNYHIEKIDGFTVETMGGSFSEITLPGGHSVGLIGNPKLPARKELIEIPEGAEVSVEVLGYSVTEVKLIEYGYTHPLMPVQPSMSKSQEVQDVPFEKDVASYNVDRYTEHPLATVEVLGRLRGVRLARVVVAPIQYNPQRNMIKIYNDLEVKINLIGGDENQTDYIKQSTYSPYFDVVYEQILNNRDHDYPNHPDLTKYPVKYLIVSDPMFENTLQPFIEWKIKKGFEVIVGYTNEIGSSVSSIQNWLWDHYDAGTPEDPAPSFILFVGDVQQIPASATGSSTNKKTDLYYGSVDGDYFPEMYYGRFSATTVSQLQAQIDKTLYYEKYQFDNPAYLDDVTLIAGADGTWNPNVGQPTVQYGTENYFNAAYGFDEVHDYLTSYSGCYDTVDDGVGFINYTAHCGETEWSDPHLSQSDVNNFTNVNKYPLAIGNCCLAADFGYSECIGETWMRKANGGAVAYIGSSPSSYWFEDFYWSVGAFPIQGDNNGYVPTYEETTLGVYDAPFVSDYVTADALIFVGNLAVTEVDIQGYPSHSSPLYYWQAYNLLGDPSLMPYMTQGEVNTVDYMDILPIGVDFFEVSADPGSYVAISFDGNLHGTAIVGETGSVEVSITPILDGGMADIVVTKPQYQPFMTQIQVAPLDGPFITIDSYVISTDDDDTIEFGETVSVNVTLKNVGTESATDVNMTLTMSDFFINLTDDSQGFGTIPAGGFSTQENAYEFIVSTSVTNAYNFSMDALIATAEESWENDLSFTAYSPVVTIGTVTVSNDENSNGRLDPGETADVVVTLVNDGGAEAETVQAILSTLDNHITINTSSADVAVLNAYSNEDVTFNVTVSEETEIGHSAVFSVVVNADNDYTASETFALSIGLCLEDFEAGTFMMYPWEFSGNADWFITNTAYEGVYASQSMDINDNQTAGMEVTLNVTSADNISFYCKVSSESSSYSFYDGLKFYIDGVEQGDGWQGEIDWTEASFPVSQGEHTFSWIYSKDGTVSSGEDCAWVDYIVFPPVSPPAHPDIAVEPAELTLTADAGETATAQVTIANEGTTGLGYSIETTADWLTVFPVSGIVNPTQSQVLTVTADAENLSEGTYTGTITINSNDPDEGEVDISTTFIVGPSEITINTDHLANWNMVGLPITTDNAEPQQVYPQSINNTLYAFTESGYTLETNLIPGTGYWLRFNEVGEDTLIGGEIEDLTILLREGWNMVSGLSQENGGWIDENNIVIPNTLYGFGESGYFNAPSLDPGYGYWLRANAEGEIPITSNGGTAKVIEPTKLTANQITINGTTLYFGITLSEEDRLSYSLPPTPPLGAPDVRFSDDMKITQDEGRILLQGDTPTITITYSIIREPGDHMKWILTNPSTDEAYELEGEGAFTVPTTPTFHLEKVREIPTEFALKQNYPNPFNPITTIMYDVPKESHVTLTVYDLMGRVVKELVSGKINAGTHSIIWNGTDTHGQPVASGMYLYQLKTDNFMKTKKLVLLK